MEGIEFLNSQPGRLSLAIHKVKDNQVLARNLENSFGAIRGIHQVEADAVKGTVSITYDRQELTSMAFLLKLKETFAAFFPEISPGQLLAWASRNQDFIT